MKYLQELLEQLRVSLEEASSGMLGAEEASGDAVVELIDRVTDEDEEDERQELLEELEELSEQIQGLNGEIGDIIDRLAEITAKVKGE